MKGIELLLPDLVVLEIFMVLAMRARVKSVHRSFRNLEFDEAILIAELTDSIFIWVLPILGTTAVIAYLSGIGLALAIAFVTILVTLVFYLAVIDRKRIKQLPNAITFIFLANLVVSILQGRHPLNLAETAFWWAIYEFGIYAFTTRPSRSLILRVIILTALLCLQSYKVTFYRMSAPYIAVQNESAFFVFLTVILISFTLRNLSGIKKLRYAHLL